MLCATSFAGAADDASYAFGDVYIGGSLNATYPTSFSEDSFSSGGTNPGIHYRYFMHDRWVVGVSGGFKIFHTLDGAERAFFSITQKSTRIHRIYHPAWFGIGASAMYLAPVEKATLPYTRDRDFPAQIVGVGLHTVLFYKISDTMIAHLEVERWRGTNNNRLHVFETSLGLSLAVPTSHF